MIPNIFLFAIMLGFSTKIFTKLKSRVQLYSILMDRAIVLQDWRRQKALWQEADQAARHSLSSISFPPELLLGMIL